MIHYHGTPITPMGAAAEVLAGRHAFVSFERPDQIGEVAEACQSFALDNGAYSKWRQGGQLDVKGYVAWVDEWKRHPGFDWCIIPDVVDGTEADNDRMLASFREAGGDLLGSVPVWHLHESFDRLAYLCHAYKRVALGSSGAYANPGTQSWWQRMGSAMDAICDEHGRPPAKLHGLRMLNNTICSQIPLSSADSTNVARNHARGRKVHSVGETMAALLLVKRIEAHAAAESWTRTFGHQENLNLVG